MSTVESLEHDPAFPYVVLFWDYVAAKFPSGLSGKNNAKDFAEHGHGKFVDTTPKPKIPEDAEFITWRDLAGDVYAAVKIIRALGVTWQVGADYWFEEDFLKEWIKDSEVTVLVPRLQSDVE